MPAVPSCGTDLAARTLHVLNLPACSPYLAPLPPFYVQAERPGKFMLAAAMGFMVNSLAYIVIQVRLTSVLACFLAVMFRCSHGLLFKESCAVLMLAHLPT